MRRILPCFLLSSAALMADSLDHRLDVLETQMQQLRMQSVYGNYGANTASAYPFLESWGLYFEGEAIYWNFFMGGTDYTYVNQANPSTTVLVDDLQYLDFDWRFAYRFTLGYQFDSPDLDLWSTFTRFTTDQNTSVDLPDGPNARLFPNQAVDENPDYTSSSQSSDFEFNVLDINLGRNYFLRKTFSMHPFIGVRGAKIDERTKTSWEGSISSDFHYKSSNEFWGLGILGGTEARWHFDSNWSLFGSVLGSLLYGWYDVDTTIQEIYPSPITDLKLDSDLRRVVPNMTADVGATWEYVPCQRRVRFALTLAYEFQYWWAYNQTLHTKYGVQYAWDRLAEDFGMQGVKFNAGLDF